jgi:hypothetical protein
MTNFPIVMTRRSSGLFAPDLAPIIIPDIGVGMRAQCAAILRRAKSGTELKRWDFSNKLANTLMNGLMTNTAGYPGMAVEVDANNFFAAGTGTTPPAATDNALVAEIATGGRASSTVTIAGYNAALPDNCQIQRKCTFSTSQANGTIGEFGWVSASTGVGLRARAVPKDNTGTQTTISKTSAATLDLYWNIFMYYIQTDVVLNRTLTATPYTITVRAVGANSATPAAYFLVSRAPQWSDLGARYVGSMVPRTNSASSGTAVGVASVDAYVANSYQRAITYNLTNGTVAFQTLTNCGGNSGDTYACIQLGISPAVVGTVQLKMKLSLTPN